jgi:hypothetical protein
MKTRQALKVIEAKINQLNAAQENYKSNVYELKTEYLDWAPVGWTAEITMVYEKPHYVSGHATMTDAIKALAELIETW